VTRLASVLFVALGLVACASSGSQQPGQDQNSQRDIPRDSESLRDRGTETRPDASLSATLLTVYFDYDEARLRPDAKESLRRNAELLRGKPQARVELQGNCDERGTEEYNLALGKRRAESAKQYLADLGVPAGRLTTVSFGEENPAVSGSGDAVWAKNRRVDFVVR